MKRNLILLTLIMLVQIAFCNAGPGSLTLKQQDSLSAYTGKFQTIQETPISYAELIIENGKLTARLSNGQTLILKQLSGDNFVVPEQNLAIKFIRDATDKVVKIAVNGNIEWIKSDPASQNTGNVKPVAPADYLGKYQITMNGQTAVIEISLKDGQLWATQLWDGASSVLDYRSGDDFMIRALNMQLKFKRDQNKNIIQMLLNGNDLFTRIKN
ncbi:MAG: hypothetical protein JWR09_2230 [Mucilaginibacter sp.]|nr:hypothetical protein [Mucilaginibacter sp.]